MHMRSAGAFVDRDLNTRPEGATRDPSTMGYVMAMGLIAMGLMVGCWVWTRSVWARCNVVQCGGMRDWFDGNLRKSLMRLCLVV